ncbi:Domain protein of unknown function [Congregibacter litoralis KT71]|uniref:Alginate export domain-containing protein n=2 Tax=Congregibacter TaxID=393661 RepID=A4A3Q8_9GAMM|nr:Domain protein of unknown function [Congregibacter litoralis KT71]
MVSLRLGAALMVMTALLLGAGDKTLAQSGDGARGWSFDADLRLRSEYLADSFRLLAPDHDHIQLARTVVGASFEASDWGLRAEVQDSRAWGAKSQSPIGTDDINTLEPINLKLWKRWIREEGSSLTLTAGRLTMDYGSRRLLARNNFRNTSNAFQGVLLTHDAASGTARVFYTLPLQRRPDGLERESLLNREFRLDKAGSSERFWGGSFDHRLSGEKASLGVYLFGSELRDRPSRPVADRDLTTLGSRFLWARGGADFEFEAAYQWGESLPGALSTGDALDHRAWFTHVHAGLDVGPGLNLRLGYDQATGDRDPLDGRNERFDRLYGARAFELGPSGIFGAAVRSNLRAPFLRAQWRATGSQRWLLAYRWLALDAPRDFFVTGARRDVSGESGREIGGQWELSWRWLPEQYAFSVEAGGAYLDKGAYFSGFSQAPLNPAAPDDTHYLYTQLHWRF